MPGSSDGSDSDGMDVCSDIDSIATGKGAKRKYDQKELLDTINTLSQEEIKEVIGISKKRISDKQFNKNVPTKKPPTNSKKESTSIASTSTDKNEFQQQKIPTTKTNIDNSQRNLKHKNYSSIMKEITNKQYANLFYITSDPTINNRLKMADVWESVRPSNKDIILMTKKGFLLKSDTPKVILINTLKSLQKHKKITAFIETSPYKFTKPTSASSQSFSCVISSVEHDISDTQISEHLSNLKMEHRYCKRIVAKSNDKPTHFIRIITSNISAYEKLLNNGVFYKSRHYAVYPSSPPPPAPLPCSKCLEFTHETMDCKTPTKCQKCGENHSTNRCRSELPPKCNSCGSTEHQAWSFKCPNRPLRPIDGIPNIPVKTLNKKSHEITSELKKNSRIHTPLTIHDIIINTYVNKLNKPKNTNREELIQKLRKRFITEYNIETSITFVSNNRIYILMFDMDLNDFNSPTETVPGINNAQIHASI